MSCDNARKLAAHSHYAQSPQDSDSADDESSSGEPRIRTSCLSSYQNDVCKYFIGCSARAADGLSTQTPTYTAHNQV